MQHELTNAEVTEREVCGPLTCVLLGAWLLASPAALGYQGEPMAWSDYLSGGIALVLSAAALLSNRRMWMMWGLCFLGIWLLHAPLILWTQSAAAYLNSTIVGIGLITFSVVLPRSHWHKQQRSPEIPPGWTFNPSSWIQRTPIIALAWINFFLARYLAAYQLDHIAWPWDPFFGDGTQQVLDSDISEAFPISDAGLGAAAYIIEALIGYMGTASRWRTAPWTVALFGILVIPVGVVSTVLMILQPVAVGAWCTICLITAALMIVMACLALPEVVAMLQYLARCRSAGRSVWRTFWLGGDDEGDAMESPPAQFTSTTIAALLRAMVCGTTMPWTLTISALIGICFVAAPDVMGIGDSAMDAHIIAGALVIVISVLAMSEVLRVTRLANIPVAIVLVALVWILEGSPAAAQIVTTIAGLILIVGSLPRGSVQQRYGAWEQWIR